ncbi:MAG: tRNA uridine-5-carboxymethylaminomethyl(34) synthesis GTPase MnmE [Caulobacteraceae bacterium]|nr:tRNA uridine-5-carboxymethylaminomethyl(34) synthesis GTPase MnmE [Caulobacteraceae bacterium]
MKPDTIAALATGAGRAGVAVIRLSGPAAGSTLSALTARDLPKPRMATREAFCDPRTGVSLDDGLALWFPGPHSFTGEDVVELHIHGGPAVIAAVIDAALSQPGVRPAEPGEYTRRAFENGKLDLAEAEGLADLVDAETEGQRRQALRQRRGALSAVYEGWRARLIEAAALIEAEIDFPDEDLPGALAQRASPILQALANDMGQHLNDAHRGERIRDGFRIAIVGPPNAGKSSLLNALAQREAAIVSDIPGTTRDVVEVRLVLAGFPVWIADTAGLREAADAIEAEGVRRALARAEEADLRMAVVEADGSDLARQMLRRRDLAHGDCLAARAEARPYRRACFELLRGWTRSKTPGHSLRPERSVNPAISSPRQRSAAKRRQCSPAPAIAAWWKRHGPRCYAQSRRSKSAPNWRPKTPALRPIRSGV